LRRAERHGAQLYTASLGKATASGDQEVVIAYTYRVLVQRHSHMLAIDIPQLTKGLKIAFRYGKTAEQARVTCSPASVPSPSIEVSYDDWVLAKAGAAFVWVIEDELTLIDRRPG
jgi:hypothetical protein